MMDRPTDGRTRRMARLFSRSDGRAFILALDDGMLSGPRGILQRDAVTYERWEAAGVTGILAHAGFIRSTAVPPTLAIVSNLAGGTMHAQPTRRTIVSSVDYAIGLGADLVSYQIHVGSQYQNEMLNTAGLIVARASRFNIPVMLVAYPRTENASGSPDDLQRLREENASEYALRCIHAARVAMELGADVVKIRNPGTAEGCQAIARACAPIPTVVSGGSPSRTPSDPIDDVRTALENGARGLAVGRRVIDADHPGRAIERFAKLLADVGERRPP
jgi:DhnA family fructose-bisphosphate aldolase class Ia